MTIRIFSQGIHKRNQGDESKREEGDRGLGEDDQDAAENRQAEI
jgi:hypothetical protein